MRASSQPAPPDTPPARPARAASAARRRARTQHREAGRGAGRAICSLLAGSTSQSTSAWRKISAAKPFQETSPAPVEMHEAAHLALEQPDQGRRQVPGPRRRADLVVDDLHRVALAGQAQHRVDEVRAVHPVQPGRAHDRVLGGGAPAPGARLRASSSPYTERGAGRVGLDVRRARARRRRAARRRRTRSRWRRAAAARRPRAAARARLPGAGRR